MKMSARPELSLVLNPALLFPDEIQFHHPIFVLFCFVYSNDNRIGKVQVDALFFYKARAILSVYLRYTV